MRYSISSTSLLSSTRPLRGGRPLRTHDYMGAVPPPPIPAPEARWALFLDVDGTLLELAPTPDSVKIPDGLVDLLRRLHAHLDGALALVSGRRIEVVDALFAPLQLPCAGLHGLEWRDSNGRESRAPINPGALAAMRSTVQRIVEKFPEVLVEDKIFSIAFHFRNARLQQAALRVELETIAFDTGFVIQAGIDVYELKPPGRNKGSALNMFMHDTRFHNRVPIYIGDDLTDENALSAAQKMAGIGIQVGTVMPSAARFGLADPAAVLHWLRRWDEQLSL